jgi:hypothetical protein
VMARVASQVDTPFEALDDDLFDMHCHRSSNARHIQASGR